MPLDIFTYLRSIDQGRYRSIVLHAPYQQSEMMSAFVKKVCQQSNGQYLDLLDFFISSPTLSSQVDTFSPEKFRELMVERSSNSRLLVIDKADFLFDAWRKLEKRNFFAMMKNQWDGFKQTTAAKVIIVLQTNDEIRTEANLSHQDPNRIVTLSDFNDIL